MLNTHVIVRPTRGTLIIAALLIFARSSSAKCVGYTFDHLLSNKVGSAHVIFHGTVRDVTHSPWVTFEVDRVWKGEVSRRFEIIHPYQATSERVVDGLPAFELNQSYFVAGNLLKSEFLGAVGETPPPPTGPTFVANICASRVSTLEQAIRIANGKKGKRPR